MFCWTLHWSVKPVEFIGTPIQETFTVIWYCSKDLLRCYITVWFYIIGLQITEIWAFHCEDVTHFLEAYERDYAVFATYT